MAGDFLWERVELYGASNWGLSVGFLVSLPLQGKAFNAETQPTDKPQFDNEPTGYLCFFLNRP